MGGGLGGYGSKKLCWWRINFGFKIIWQRNLPWETSLWSFQRKYWPRQQCWWLAASSISWRCWWWGTLVLQQYWLARHCASRVGYTEQEEALSSGARFQGHVAVTGQWCRFISCSQTQTSHPRVFHVPSDGWHTGHAGFAPLGVEKHTVISWVLSSLSHPYGPELVKRQAHIWSHHRHLGMAVGPGSSSHPGGGLHACFCRKKCFYFCLRNGSGSSGHSWCHASLCTS